MISSQSSEPSFYCLQTLIKHFSQQKVASFQNRQICSFLISPKTKERPDSVGALFIPAKLQFLGPVVVMIVIIPVVLVVPAMLMLIPFSSFMELVPPVVRLPAVVTVLFNRASLPRKQIGPGLFSIDV